MRRSLFVSVTLVASGLHCLSAASAPSLHDAFDAKQAYAYTAQIVGFGERQPGQVGHKKTEDLILEVLQKGGAQIERDDFRAKTWGAPSQRSGIIGALHRLCDVTVQIDGDPRCEMAFHSPPASPRRRRERSV